MAAPTRSRRHRGWLIAAAFSSFVAFVVYRSFYVAGFRCEVCITFQGRQACRSVDGPTEHEARSGAVTNTCAQLSSGVTDSIACERTPPSKADCRALD